MAVVVGEFPTYARAQEAVRALIGADFSSEAISVLGRRRDENLGNDTPLESRPDEIDTSGAAIGVGTGAVLGGALAAMGLAIPGIGPVLVAGPVAAALAGASIGAAAGGLIGVLVDLGVPDEEARRYTEAVRAGATLVTVTVDETMADRAVAIMREHAAVEVEEREDGRPGVRLYRRSTS